MYDGELVAGDMPMPRLNYNIPPDIPQPRNYRTWAGSQAVAVYVRRATDGSGTMLVVGTVQPQSSAVGNAPLALNASLTLPAADGTVGAGPRLTLEFRRQGSTYLITPGGGGGGVGSVSQLDAWHEATHPAYWSRDVEVEAELFDGRRALGGGAGGAPAVRTERPAGAGDGDYGAFTTWVELGREGGAAAVSYTVRPRCADGGACEFVVWVRARGCVAVTVAGRAVGPTAACAEGGAWGWVKVGAVSLAGDAAVVLTVAAAGRAAVDVDALRLAAVLSIAADVQ